MHLHHHCDDGGQVRMMTRPGICRCRCRSSSRGRASARWRRRRPAGCPMPGWAPTARLGRPPATQGPAAAPVAREPERARSWRSGAWRMRCRRRGWSAPRLTTSARARPAARERVRAVAAPCAKKRSLRSVLTLCGGRGRARALCCWLLCQLLTTNIEPLLAASVVGNDAVRCAS